jgi:hypothetical protein
MHARLSGTRIQIRSSGLPALAGERLKFVLWVSSEGDELTVEVDS